MLKRTTGRLLLTLLVVTGLAGTLNTSSLSPKERKQAINLIKNSRKQVLNSIEGLSSRQRKFKPSSHDLSINELILLMTKKEKQCSEELRAFMNQPANSENRLHIALTDEQLLENDNYAVCKTDLQDINATSWKDADEAIRKFSMLQNEHIKYIRTSTEDLRNHVIKTTAGWIDCYQYFLLLADQNNYFAERINQVRSSKHFPKK
ncbi:MAG: hypothetical protein E6H09_07570 [Bacteroidetes bacterium]|jgi:hypothetical protein|nr:MAG: hypothetical protein E6H09_07570 [Bacteroidota bacterium]